MDSAAEVRALAVELQRVVRYLGISEADMQKAHMRFEPNVNLIITSNGTEYRTPITEIKNLNSFRALEGSVDYEVHRQLDDFQQTGRVMEMGGKTTRGWDDDKEQTVLQREKEEAHDYRYFPDPDLVPVELGGQWLDSIRAHLCELGIKKQTRFVSEYKLSDYDAGVLTAQRATAEFFEQAVAAGGGAKRICNLLTQVGLKLANEAGCGLAELGLLPERVSELAQMIEAGTVNPSAGNTIMQQMVKTGKEPQDIAWQFNLVQTSDTEQLETIVNQVLAENPKAVKDATSGGKKSKKALGFLLGGVMQKTKGQANPKVVSQILAEKIN